MPFLSFLYTCIPVSPYLHLKIANYRCPKCRNEVCNENICCDKCKKKYHFDCSDLSKQQIRSHKINKYKKWKCLNCIDKYCKNCDKIFSDSTFNSISCDKCNNWYHDFCTNLNVAEFDDFCNNKNKFWNFFLFKL